MYDSILLPTDGSENASEALSHAIEAANSYDADLHIVSVVDERVILAAAPEDKEEVREDLAAEANDAVEELTARATDAGLDVTAATPSGVPYREILSYADDEAVDLLVLGTHGRTGREKRLNLGSTTERVIKDGDRPVLVVDIS
ncbi:UspA domain protein [Natronomonas pharaonis DSM 2160]|uniref:UspA domain protein n=1 Tax=Natronomonas pharaonis (strain ATCC 35678 / DSM 2160 / CIP 103997 / JCM 8858 / NBRC 14720 / NCIMB 2260 / Gabara) TaxID=348780 RepID=A0A1U7EWB1_NATPD|nr:universal stress protein [Natronomonas pharaonis]CAI49371.1 UspA domain protein [Natronomonas pharaonis DSM 2160]